MKLSTYVRFAVWDFLLVALASVALAYTALDGFYVDPSFRFGIVPGALAAALVFALFVVSYKKSFLLPGGIAYGVAAVGCCVAGALASETDILVDGEGNYFIAVATVVVASTVPFLLRRGRAGCALLFIAGVFTCAWVEFFYEGGDVVWALVVLAAALALVVYKNYQLAARRATSVRTLSFSAGFAVAACVVAVSVGVGALAWYGIVAGLNPDVLDVKLVTEYRSFEEREVHGTSSEYLTPNFDMTSDQTNDGVRTTDDLREGEDGIETPARAKERSTDESESAGTFLGIDLEALQDAFDFQAHPEFIDAVLPWLVAIAALIVCAIVGFFVGRRAWRSRRLARIQAKPLQDQAREIYLFLISRLSKLGFTVPDGLTQLEFAQSVEPSLQRFDELAGVPFRTLAGVYVDVVYGDYEPTEGEVAGFASYYKAFWKAARKQLGSVRYFFKSFVL